MYVAHFRIAWYRNLRCVQKEQLVLRENARQKELEEVAKKRQGELKAKLEKAGVRPLEMERKLDIILDRCVEVTG